MSKGQGTGKHTHAKTKAKIQAKPQAKTTAKTQAKAGAEQRQGQKQRQSALKRMSTVLDFAKAKAQQVALDEKDWKLKFRKLVGGISSIGHDMLASGRAMAAWHKQ